MTPITQAAALDDRTSAAPAAAGDRAHLWRVARHDGLECLSARFRHHRYAPHSHETYVIGTITAGREGWRLNGQWMTAGVGDVCFVQPGEIHDGEPVDSGYAYRMSYPTVGLLHEIACDRAEAAGRRPPRGTPVFPRPIAADPEAATAFVRAHRALEEGSPALGGDQAMLAAWALMLERHGDLGSAEPRRGHEPAAIARAKEVLAARLDQDLDLATLSGIVGLGRTRLIEAFRGATGLTPHAWRTDRRILAARRLLRAGRSPADVAAETGFFDQAHLTRAFKARLGVTPAVFARAPSR